MKKNTQNTQKEAKIRFQNYNEPSSSVKNFIKKF